MKQEIMNRSDHGLSNISFQQKSTGLSLVITSSATFYFIAKAWPMRPAAVVSDTIPAGYGGLVLTTLILLIVAQIVLQAVLAIGQGTIESVSEVAQTAALKAKRNAYFVLVVGMLTAVGSIFAETLTPFDTANLVILGLALAEIVHAASQLFYARR